MQIDFHFAVTYICARLAGMSASDADTVAHAAQYVDDATNDGQVEFTSGQRYVRVTSAHKMLDLRLNSNEGDNRLVWAPFHFLPGNMADPTPCSPEQDFINRMVCQPNSRIAQEMVQDCVAQKNLPFALHRLGIALHTYADTWAHQGFAGLVCDVNQLASIGVDPDPAYLGTPTWDSLNSGMMSIKSHVANFMAVGHAAALTLPDMPFLRWHFQRKNGEQFSRDNPRDYLAAADALFNVVRRFVAGDNALPDSTMPQADREKIEHLLRTTLDIDGDVRHKAWLQTIQQGAFSFGSAQVDYIEQGPGSWKFQALGADPDTESGSERFEYNDGFLSSDWKLFHDAVQFQRLFVLHILLPRNGLSAS